MLRTDSFKSGEEYSRKLKQVDTTRYFRLHRIPTQTGKVNFPPGVLSPRGLIGHFVSIPRWHETYIDSLVFDHMIIYPCVFLRLSDGACLGRVEYFAENVKHSAVDKSNKIPLCASGLKGLLTKQNSPRTHACAFRHLNYSRAHKWRYILPPALQRPVRPMPGTT